MPVEIRELVIRAVVTERQDDAPSAPSEPERHRDDAAVIQECVKQVLKILRRNEER